MRSSSVPGTYSLPRAPVDSRTCSVIGSSSWPLERLSVEQELDSSPTHRPERPVDTRYGRTQPSGEDRGLERQDSDVARDGQAPFGQSLVCAEGDAVVQTDQDRRHRSAFGVLI